MKQLEYVLNNDKEVLAFLKSNYPMYHLSNIFFRDVQYGIQKLFERRGEKLRYPDAEKIAWEFVGKLEKEKTLNRIDKQSWVLNYPEFKKPTTKPAAPAKPAPGAAPAKAPVAGAKPLPPPSGAKPALPPLGSAKPVDGAKPTLPPLASAKPAGQAKPSLPPLTSAKPAGGAKPSLPPLASAKPVGLSSPQPPTAPPATNQMQDPVVTQGAEASGASSTSESKPVDEAKPVTTTPPPGQRKPLPPLKGNYTPAGKK